MMQNHEKIYINVTQTSPQLLPSDHTFAGEPGFVVGISSVDIKLCNSCSGPRYVIRLSPSLNLVQVRFSIPVVCLLIPEIDIEGPSFTNNPGVSTLLWSRRILVDGAGIIGHAFKASVVQTFEMLPIQLQAT